MLWVPYWVMRYVLMCYERFGNVDEALACIDDFLVDEGFSRRDKPENLFFYRGVPEWSR